MKGILFKEPLYNAIVEGKKTETRRIKNTQRPRYNAGETVYLKEPYIYTDSQGMLYMFDTPKDHDVRKIKGYFKNKLFMPESCARRFIRILDWKVQTLYQITEEEAKAEGVERGDYFYKWNETDSISEEGTYRGGFFKAWEQINGIKSIENNSDVFVYKLKLTDNG